MIRVIFFLFSCVFLLSSSAFTQTDSMEWAPVGAKWWYSYGKGNVFHGSSVHYVTLESVGDTVIQEKNARILDIKVHWAEDYPDSIAYYFQRDHPDQKLVIYQQGDSVFYLRKNKFEILYDFSLEAGDTMTITHPLVELNDWEKDSLLYIQVESIDSLEVGGEFLRTQKLKLYAPSDKNTSGYLFGDEVIEKIGGNAFFLPYNDIECDAFCPVPLRCYQDDMIFYKHLDVPCDTLVPLKSNNELVPVMQTVTLYPNPISSGNTNIQIKDMEVDSWVLRDVHGKILYRRESDAGTSEIDLPQDIRTGIYLIELRSRSQRYVKRLVVQ